MSRCSAHTLTRGVLTFSPCMRLMALKERSRQVRRVREVRPSMLVSSLKVSTSAFNPTAPSSPCNTIEDAKPNSGKITGAHYYPKHTGLDLSLNLETL